MQDIIFPRYSFASLFPLEITFQDDKHIFCHFVFDVRLGVFRGGGGGYSHRKGAGMLVGNFELNP